VKLAETLRIAPCFMQDAVEVHVPFGGDTSAIESRTFAAASFCRHKTRVASTALQLLESFSDQLLECLRLSEEVPHLLLDELGLKYQDLLGILCVSGFLDQRES
jgi:hypothetical protein